MNLGRSNPRSPGSFLKGIFGNGDEKEEIKADDFKTEKDVIAAYNTLTADEMAARKKPPRPASRSSVEYSVPQKQVPSTAAQAEVQDIFADSAEKQSTPPAPSPAAPPPPPPPSPKKTDPKQAKKNASKFLYNADRWQAPHILKTNLVSSEVTTFVSWGNHVKNAVLVLGLSLGAIGFLYLGLFYWESRVSRQGDDLVEQIRSLDAQINQAKEAVKEVDLFQRRLNLAQELMDKHIYWTRFFSALEKMFLSEARLSGGFKSSLDGRYTFVIDVGSYAGVYEQILALRNNPLVQAVRVDSASLESKNDKTGFVSDERVKFSLELVIDPQVLTDKK